MATNRVSHSGFVSTSNSGREAIRNLNNVARRSRMGVRGDHESGAIHLNRRSISSMPLVRSFNSRNELGSLGRVIVTEMRFGMFGEMIFVDIFFPPGGNLADRNLPRNSGQRGIQQI